MKKLFILCLSCWLGLNGFAQVTDENVPDPPTGGLFTTEECHIQSQGNDIYGVRLVPNDNQAKHPVAILSHGYNSTPAVYYELASMLANDGFICYFYDFPGGSIRHRSTGKTTEMSLLTERQNVTDIIHTVMTWPNVDKNNIFLVGESQGGIVSALTAAHEKENVKAIALMYPAFSIPFGTKRFKSVNEIPETVEALGMTVGRKYYADIWNMDAYKESSAFDKDVLIVHGDNDKLVDLDFSKKALPYYKHAELKVIPGGPHVFRKMGDILLNAKYIHDFFVAETKK